MKFSPDPKPEKKLKEKKPLKRTPLKKKFRKATGELEIFKCIAATTLPVSFISGIPIHPVGVQNMAHVLSKKQYPKFRLNPRNIVLLTDEEHRLYDAGTESDRLKYQIQMFHNKNIVVSWGKLRELYNNLKQQYKSLPEMKTADNIVKNAFAGVRNIIHDQALVTHVITIAKACCEEYASQFQSKKEEQCCGSCKTFKYEDIDGCGICGISQFAKNCKEGTDCKLYKQLKKK